MGLFGILFKPKKRNCWESIGTINNAHEKLDKKVDPRIIKQLVDIVESSYGIKVGYVIGRSFRYKAVAVGSAWSRLEQGQHGSNETQIEIFRKLK